MKKNGTIYRQVLRVLSVLLSFSMAAGGVAGEVCSAQPLSAAGGAGVASLSELSAETFNLPSDLGETRSVFGCEGDRFVVHIQDAHCNRFAQEKVYRMMEHLNAEYGITVANLEGGEGEYDLSVFTDTADPSAGFRAAKAFLNEGDLNGAELFGVSRPEDTLLWGIEDRDLYIRNLRVFRKSLGNREAALAVIRDISRRLSMLKERLYGKELLALDRQSERYREGSIGFKEYLDFLIMQGKRHIIGVQKYPNLFLLYQSTLQEDDVDFRKARRQRNVLIDRLQKRLSLYDKRELIGMTLSLKLKRITKKEYYDLLLKMADRAGIGVDVYPDLKMYAVYVSTYGAVDRSRVMDEMSRLKNDLTGVLIENEAQSRLYECSRGAGVLKGMFSCRLTADEYRYFRENREALRAGVFLDLFDEHGVSSFAGGAAGMGPGDIDAYADELSGFYELSFARDRAFVENLKFGHIPGTDKKAAFLVTGGFHSENLYRLLRERGISYVSVTPSFISEEGYECPYFELLAGKETGLTRKVRKVMARSSVLQIPSKLSGLSDIWPRTGLDSFEASAQLRILVEMGYVVRVVNEEGGELLSLGEEGTPLELTVEQLADMAHERVIDAPIENAFRKGDVRTLESVAPAARKNAVDFLKGRAAELEGIGDDAGARKLSIIAEGLEKVEIDLVGGVAGFTGHAGGRGIHINAAAVRKADGRIDTVRLEELIIHEAVAGYARDHGLSSLLEMMYSDRAVSLSDLSNRLSGENVLRAAPLWEIKERAARLSGGRDFAASATGWDVDKIEQLDDVPVRGMNVRDRVVPLGDAHGDLNAVRDYLEGAGLIRKGDAGDGSEDEWVGKDAILVQMGDMVDRAPDGMDPARAFMYMRELQEKARQWRKDNGFEGDGVIRLIGNHEMHYLYFNSYDMDEMTMGEVIKQFGQQRGFWEEDLELDREFIDALRSDIREGRIRAVYEKGGKVFSHGVVMEHHVDLVRGERESITAEEFVEEVNSIFAETARQNKYTHPLFNCYPGSDPDDFGLFKAYAGDLDAIESMGSVRAYEGWEQVVAHDFSERRLVAYRGGNIICVDVGMTDVYQEPGLSRKEVLIFEKGDVYRARPPADEAQKADTVRVPREEVVDIEDVLEDEDLRIAVDDTRDLMRREVSNILRDLRYGEEPSLVGEIPGLTKKMEEAFGRHQLTITSMGKGRYIVMANHGSLTIETKSWTELGMSAEPAAGEKEQAYKAYMEWRKRRKVFPEGNLKRAEEDFRREFTRPYGIRIKNAYSAGQIYFFMELLKLMPASLLESEFLTTIDLRASRDRGARYAQYKDAANEVGILDGTDLDRYQLTIFFAHEMGHALMRLMTSGQLEDMRDLHREMMDKGAMIGIDAMVNQRASERIMYQEMFDEFIAENLMHFIVLGEEGMVAGPHKEMRKELFDLYSGFYGDRKISVSRNGEIEFTDNIGMAPGERLAARKKPITRHITSDQRRFISAVNSVAYAAPDGTERALTEGLRTLVSRPKAPAIRSEDVRRFLEVVEDPGRFDDAVGALKERVYGHMDRKVKLEREQLRGRAGKYFSSGGAIQGLRRKNDRMRSYAEKSLSDEDMEKLIAGIVRKRGLDDGTYNFGNLFFSQAERARQLAFSMSREAIEAELEQFEENVTAMRTMLDMGRPYRLELALAIKDLMVARNGPDWRGDAGMFTADEIRFIVSITQVFRALEAGESRDDALAEGAGVLLSDETPALSPAAVKRYMRLREKDIESFRAVRQELADAMLARGLRDQRKARDSMERSLRRRLDASSLLDSRSVLSFLASGVPEETLTVYGRVDEIVFEKVKNGLAAEKAHRYDIAARAYADAVGAIKSFEDKYAGDLTSELNSHIGRRRKWLISRWNRVRRRGGRSSRTPSLKYPGTPAPGIGREALVGLAGAARSRGGRVVPGDDPRLAEAVKRANRLIRDADLAEHPDAAARLDDAGVIQNVEILKTQLEGRAEAVSFVETDGTLVILLNSEKNVFEDYMSDPAALAQMLRHEHLEACGVLEHRQIKALEIRENGNDPLTDLNLMALKHMSDEQLRALEPGHELDPRGRYYAAARVELRSRKARAVLEMVRPDIPAAVLVPLTDEQMLIERSARRRVSNRARRVIDKRFGPNVRVYYYTRGDSGSLRQAAEKAVSEKDFSSDSRARLVAFVTPGIDSGAVSDMLQQEAVAGVVREEVDKDQRTDEVMHVVLALGLIDFSRDRRPELEARIKGLMSLMVEDPTAVSGMDLDKLLRAAVSLKIKKVDLQEIEDWQRSQNAVLMAL